MSSLIGQRLVRREDLRFVTGHGCFTADLDAPGALHAVFVRSPHAHARLVAVDVEPAMSLEGVRAVIVASDLERLGVSAIPSHARDSPLAVKNVDGTGMADASPYPLAREAVRYVGEPVALVLADTLTGAIEGAEAVAVEYDVLSAVSDLDAALADGAAPVWEEWPDNRSLQWERGDRGAVDALLAEADRVVSLTVDNPRQIVAFMEPRAAIASYDAGGDRYHLIAGSQSAHALRANLSEVLGIDPARLRVETPDTGGGFGARNVLYPEFVVVTAAARIVGAKVRWVAERSECFLADTQARSQRLEGRLGIDPTGRFTGLAVTARWCHGAYFASRSIWVLTEYQAPMICGVYAFDGSHFGLEGIFTNTVPLAAFRGVGRAEASHVLERLVDEAARSSGIDRVELRRRNFIAPEAMPHQTPAGALYDSGEFERNVDLACEAIDWASFEDRREAAASEGRFRGIGLAMYIENAGGAPQEFGRVEVSGEGSIVARVGTQDFGMGHATAYSQVIAERFGVAPESVEVIFGDTDAVARGAGSHGSRSMRIGGSALDRSARLVIERARRLASKMLEAAEADIEFADARFTIKGTDRAATLFEVASQAEADGEPLAAEDDFITEAPAYPNGCHACELEVDPETGHVTVIRYAMALDAGRVVNPMIVEGQIHGGVAQGVGQALLEAVRYDPDSGQLLSGSFMDYALPRADDLPLIDTRLNEVICADNPLGVKGAGEGATTGAPPAVANALVDALAPIGITHVELPATPERLWRQIRDARAN